MDVQVRDRPALRRVSPTAMRAYLQSRGWVHEENWRERIAVWSLENDGQTHQILAPLREASDRYHARIAEALSTLAELETRSQLDVYYDLIGAGADVIRLRPLNGVGQSGWTLTDSVVFLTRARDLLMAAARTAEHPGLPVYRGGISSKVTDYVRSIRPLPGYETGPELTLHSQVPAGYGVQEDLGDTFHAPFPRQATIALNNGLREADRTAAAVIGGEDITNAFETAPSQGVSANFCDAVAALAQRGHGVGVSLSWATIRPAEASDSEFQFAESAASLFTEGAEILRRNSPFTDAHVVGEIVGLDRQRREEFDGHSVVVCELDDRPIALQVRFQSADYDEVWRAFRDGISISVDGDVHREGRRYTLLNPRNFAVLAADTSTPSASPQLPQ